MHHFVACQPPRKPTQKKNRKIYFFFFQQMLILSQFRIFAHWVFGFDPPVIDDALHTEKRLKTEATADPVTNV